MNSKTALLAVIALSSFALTARSEKISLIGATVINPADGKVLPNATVVINRDKIERAARSCGGPAHLERLARQTRSRRSADCEDRHARSGARVRAQAGGTKTGSGEDLVHRRQRSSGRFLPPDCPRYHRRESCAQDS